MSLLTSRILLMAGVEPPSKWLCKINWLPSSDDGTSGACRDQSGNLYVTAFSVTTGAYSPSFSLNKLSPSGTLIWTRAYTFPGSGTTPSPPALINGSIYIASGFQPNYMRINPSDGSVIAARSCAIAGLAASTFCFCQIPGTTDVLVAGSIGSTALTFWYARIRADDTVVWTRRVTTASSGAPASIVIDSPTTAVIYTGSDGLNIIMRIDFDGNMLLGRRWSLGDSSSSTNVLLYDRLNNRFIITYSYRTGGSTFGVAGIASLNSSFNQIWARAYDAADNEHFLGGVVDSSGNIYTAINVNGATRTLVHKYTSNATPIWRWRYNRSSLSFIYDQPFILNANETRLHFGSGRALTTENALYWRVPTDSIPTPGTYGGVTVVADTAVLSAVNLPAMTAAPTPSTATLTLTPISIPVSTNVGIQFFPIP